jgi:hypothetical protein
MTLANQLFFLILSFLLSFVGAYIGLLFKIHEIISSLGENKDEMLTQADDPDKICFSCKKITTGRGQITFRVKGKELLVVDMVCFVNSIKKTMKKRKALNP